MPVDLPIEPDDLTRQLRLLEDAISDHNEQNNETVSIVSTTGTAGPISTSNTELLENSFLETQTSEVRFYRQQIVLEENIRDDLEFDSQCFDDYLFESNSLTRFIEKKTNRNLKHIDLSKCYNCSNKLNDNAMILALSIKSRQIVVEINLCDNCHKRHYFRCDTCEKFLDRRLEHKMGIPKKKRSDKQEFHCLDCFNKKYFSCSSCCGASLIKDVWIYNNAKFCPLCKMRHFVECKNCNIWIAKECGNDFKGDCYCDRCFNDSYCKCWDCGAGHHRCESFTYNGRSYCVNCKESNFNICVACDRWCNKEHHYDRKNYCKKCFTKRFYQCNNCREYYSLIGSIKHDRGIYCKICFDGKIKYQINRYYYKPKPIFYGKNDYHFGIELEVAFFNDSGECDYKARIKDLINKTDGILYLKDDTSISSCGKSGFEIVTHPMTYEWILNNQEILDPIFCLSKCGFKSYHAGSCGMHIHVGMKDISAMQLHKILTFIYGRTGRAFASAISMRNEDDLKNWSSFDNTSKIVRRVLNKKRLDEDDTSRRSAVNLNHNNTIEFRFFKGTLRKETFLRNIEFVKALMDFTNDLNIGKGEMGAKEFIKFVKKNKKIYPKLITMFTDFKFRKRLSSYLPSLALLAMEAGIDKKL